MATGKYFYPLRESDNPFNVRLEPCSEEVYRAVMPDIWRGIKRMKAQGLCCCPKHKAMLCDLDCAFCKYQKIGTSVSLDAPLSDDDEMTYADTIPDESETPEIIIEKLTIKIGLAKLSETDYQILIAMVRYDSEREAAQKLGMARSTFKRRLDKARQHALKLLEDVL